MTKEIENLEEKIEELRLIIPLASYRKIMAYVALVDTEITGWADVNYNEARNAFIMEEVYLIPQTVGSTTVHVNEEAHSNFLYERMKTGADKMPACWWHSHSTMEAFLSAQDEETLKHYQNKDFIIALVVNKNRQMKAKAYVYAEEKIGLFGVEKIIKKQIKIEDLDITIEFAYERIPEAIKKEIKEKVTKREYGISVFNKQKYNGTYRSLPKKLTKALKIVREKQLVKQWDSITKQYVYIGHKSGEIYIDGWKTLNEEETGIYTGEEETEIYTGEKGVNNWQKTPEEEADEILEKTYAKMQREYEEEKEKEIN